MSEQVWAEHGLTGIVLGALFLLIGVFLKVLVMKDNKFMEFISHQSRTNEDARAKDRQEAREDRQREAIDRKENTQALAESLDSLASEIGLQAANRQKETSLLVSRLDQISKK